MVAPYLDCNAAAKAIIELSDNPSFKKEVSDVTRRLAQTTFDMENYVERLDELGCAAAGEMEQRKESFATIRDD
jgi:hypothetical protein